MFVPYFGLLESISRVSLLTDNIIILFRILLIYCFCIYKMCLAISHLMIRISKRRKFGLEYIWRRSHVLFTVIAFVLTFAVLVRIVFLATKPWSVSLNFWMFSGWQNYKRTSSLKMVSTLETETPLSFTKSDNVLLSSKCNITVIKVSTDYCLAVTRYWLVINHHGLKHSSFRRCEHRILSLQLVYTNWLPFNIYHWLSAAVFLS